MFRYGTHTLSEYFTVSFTTLSGASIGTVGDVLLSSGVSGIGYPTISTAALLSRTVEIHGEGSITLSAYDGMRIVSKTVKVVNETTTLLSTTIVPAPQVSPVAFDAPTTTWPVVAPVTQPTTTTTMTTPWHRSRQPCPCWSSPDLRPGAAAPLPARVCVVRTTRRHRELIHKPREPAQQAGAGGGQAGPVKSRRHHQRTHDLIEGVDRHLPSRFAGSGDSRASTPRPYVSRRRLRPKRTPGPGPMRPSGSPNPATAPATPARPGSPAPPGSPHR